MNNIKSFAFYCIKTIIYIFLFGILFLLSLNFFNSFYKGGYVSLDFDGKNMGDNPIIVYYTQYENENYGDDKNKMAVVSDTEKKGAEYTFNEKIRLNSNWARNIRIDFGDYNSGALIVIRGIEYRGDYGYCKFDIEDIKNANIVNMSVEGFSEDKIILKSIGDDPYIELNDMDISQYNNYNKIWALIISVVLIFLLNKYVKLKSIYSMAIGFWNNKELIISLAVNDFKTKYAGSYFGIVWAFVQPICTILVFWFVFQVGMRNTDVGDIPFILWFIAGLIPWFFFSEAWNTATNCLIEYSFLVKKVVFEIYILPVVKILSALFVHVFFVLFMLLIYLLYDIKPNIYWVQTIYYSFCMIALVIALSFITAPLVVFFKDLGQIMNIILQFGMWLTPIMWSIDIIPEKFMWIFKLNPMYYVVQGYRDSLIYGNVFYGNIKQTVFFWGAVLVFMFVGCTIFKKLKPHFADVL